MWARNLTFILACLIGLGSVAAGLLRRNRIDDPPDFSAAAAHQDDFRQVVDQVNREFHDSLNPKPSDGGDLKSKKADLPPPLPAAARADDLKIARRLSLGLTGTVPSLEELRTLETKSPEIRVEWWLARVLADRRYSDFLAERLARSYVGTENGPFVLYRRRRFVTWLSDRLEENRPYNEIVKSIVADTGLWTDSPAVNFLTVTLQENDDGRPDPVRLAGRTTRAFLGMRVDCLQCHDDRLGNIELGTTDDPQGGQQQHFHQLAAFYGQCKTTLLGVVDDSGTYRTKYLDADEEAPVEPVPPFLDELLAPAETRRMQLANWITHPQNKPFARATVNRMWAIMFGRPLVDPVDDIPLNGPFPPGLETLADDFVSHNYDLRRLIRLIASTDVFRRDSRADFEVTADHERRWAVFPLTRLRPEQVAGGMIQACSLRTIDANAHILSQIIRYTQQNDFVNRYGDTGDDEFVGRGGTITQRLLMMNGQLVRERTEPNPLMNASTHISLLAPDDASAVEATYLSVLTRRPSPTELEHFVNRIEGSTGDERSGRLEDLFWVLLNSTEFSWNH